MTELCFSPWYWRGAAGRCHLLLLSAICQDKVWWRNCVSARGIDVEQLDGVISYDCPPFVKTYIHRPVHMYLFINWFSRIPLRYEEPLFLFEVVEMVFYFYYHTILLPKWNDLTSTYLDQKQKSRLSTLIGLGCQNISVHCLFKIHRFCFISEVRNHGPC